MASSVDTAVTDSTVRSGADEVWILVLFRAFSSKHLELCTEMPRGGVVNIVHYLRPLQVFSSKSDLNCTTTDATFVPKIVLQRSKYCFDGSNALIMLGTVAPNKTRN